MTHVITEAIVRVALQRELGVTDPLVHLVLGAVAGLYGAVLLASLGQRIGVSWAFTLSRSRLQPWVGSFDSRSAASERVRA